VIKLNNLSHEGKPIGGMQQNQSFNWHDTTTTEIFLYILIHKE
jgi:hypothetical protein